MTRRPVRRVDAARPRRGAARAAHGRRPGRRRGRGRGRCGARPRPQRARGRGRPDRARRGAGAARGRGGRRRVAADRRARWSSPSSRARCAPARWCWPGSTGWSTGPTTRRPARSARCGTSCGTGGSTTGPRWSAACWPRSPAELLRGFFRNQRGPPVISAAVACPSGRRSTPRKRVRCKPSVGSNPTATASL